MIKNKLITLFSKIIIIILVFGLLINHINLVLIVQAFDKPPNMTIQDESINEIVDFKKEELVNKKTKNSKTFKYDNGLLETEIYNKGVHFLDNGKYVNIDNTLKEYEFISSNTAQVT